jgi:hypothetical protein
VTDLGVRSAITRVQRVGVKKVVRDTEETLDEALRRVKPAVTYNAPTFSNQSVARNGSVASGSGRPPDATDIRQDRILDEAKATSGDVRRLADLFGLSIAAGNRYAATVEHPDQPHSPSRAEDLGPPDAAALPIR